MVVEEAFGRDPKGGGKEELGGEEMGFLCLGMNERGVYIVVVEKI